MKNLVLAFSILFALNNLSAQDWSTDVYKYGSLYPGYVIEKGGDKIEGYIKYRDRYSMQNQVIFFKEKGNKKSKVKYKTADLKEYKVADKLYHCIHYSGGLMAKPIRANLMVKEGCITQYVWYSRADNYSMMQKGASETEEDFARRMYPPKMIFKNIKTETVKSSGSFALKFAKKMAEFVNDDKALSAKVAAKEKGYRLLKILNIIEEYNSNCK